MKIKRLFVCLSMLLAVTMIIRGQDYMEEGKRFYNEANNLRGGHIDATREYKKAAIYLEHACKEGFGEAAFLLGEIYYWGLTGEYDRKKAFQMYKNAVELGHDRGNVQMGRCYLYGQGVEENEKKGFELIAKGVDENDPDARIYLGLCWYFGYGVEQADTIVAFMNCRNNLDRMVESEDRLFKIMLGGFCLDKRCKTKDLNTNQLVSTDLWGAVEHFNQTLVPYYMLIGAEIMYNHDKEYIYRRYYNQGGGALCIFDILSKAIKATDDNDIIAYACYLYATFLEKQRAYDGDSGDKMNYGMTRIEALTRAAQLGFKPAQKMLGDWYENGHNVSKNLLRAKEWHDKSNQ